MAGWGPRRPAPAEWPARCAAARTCTTNSFGSRSPALFETAELGMELAVLEHSAGEAQTIRGLRPKDGTVPRRRHCPKLMCRPRQSSRRALGAAPALYLAIRSARVPLL